MAWRSVVINNPARLTLKHRAIQVEQDSGTVSVPLEDIATLVIDHPQVTLTNQLLSVCASQQIAVITVGQNHTPNGVLLSFLPHSRALKIMRQQLAMSTPHKKRLWQGLVQQKLRNQAEVLTRHDEADTANRLNSLANRVRSGDPDNCEAQGAQLYFPSLFGRDFTRDHSDLANAALNYGYSIIRSALARALVGYGFLPAFGLHHKNEQNAFNLADDLIEPYRPLVDAMVLTICRDAQPEETLDTSTKAQLISLLHKDTPRLENGKSLGTSTILALINATVISLGQRVTDGECNLMLPGLTGKPS